MEVMKRALIVFAAWTGVALLFALQMHFQTVDTDPRPWRWILAWQMVGWWSWAAFTAPVCLFAAWAARLRQPALLVASHLPVALAVDVGCAALEGALKWAFGLYRTPHTLATGVGTAVSTYWTFNLLIYAMVAGLYHAWRAMRLETQLVQARLDALVGPLQPHFLFNTLHTISAYVLEDPKQANRMITRLSELLRQSFNSERGPLVTLEHELELLDHYVAIQEARFGDRLRVTFRVDPRAATAVVPTLLLQPLVENAIRHGIEPREGPGRVRVRAERVGDRLVLEVSDNGPGLHGHGAEGRNGNGGGIGLANTRARLAQLYGPAQAITVANGSEGGVVVRLEIPWRRGTSDE